MLYLSMSCQKVKISLAFFCKVGQNCIAIFCHFLPEDGVIRTCPKVFSNSGFLSLYGHEGLA